MKKRTIKISEDALKYLGELVDIDGTIASGDYNQNDVSVKTNEPKDYGQPQTSKDYGREVAQGGDRIYGYGGYSIGENSVRDIVEDKGSSPSPFGNL